MKIRFAVTLLAVAIAVIGAKASALAPVIGFVPDVVITDDTHPATGSHPFYVYPDAIDVTSIAVDPDNTVTTSTMICSYADTTGRYSINNRTSLTGDPNAPSAGENLVGGDDPQATDLNIRTLTFRDTVLSPVGGTNTAATGEVSRTVSLFASDGDLFDTATFLVYTSTTGVDRLVGSGTQVPLQRVWEASPGTMTGTGSGPTGAWTSSAYNSASATKSGNNLCLSAAADGQNLGLWIGPSKITELVKNNVYRFRLTMSNGGYIPTYHFPFWDLVLDNYEPTFSNGSGKYFGDMMLWDVNGGAESLGNGSLQQFDMWWAPMPLLDDAQAGWNDDDGLDNVAGNADDGEFSAFRDATNDIRIFLRLMDTTGGAIDGANDYGTLCLNSVQISRTTFASLTPVETVFEQNDLSGSTMAVGGIFPLQVAGGLTTPGARTYITWSGGDLTLAPYTAYYGNAAWNTEVINVDSGDNVADMGTPASLADNFPFKWEDNRLLMGRVTVMAPDLQGEINPPDLLMMQFDEPTNELLQNTAIVCSSNLLGFPKRTVSKDLVAFMFTHKRTLSTTANADRIRLRFLLINTTTLVSAGYTSNLGGITIQKFQVDEYLPPAMQ